ncbi:MULTISPECIES: DUF3278 domain-containing protein [Planococcus]|uniref:DUF3278 domain-containing protein n=1 Tax=Planococcus TaxID=1372 RepID=UPI000C79DE33|nr:MULTISPECIES: DUF3278 domain-containing protein [Planococcus]PKG46211.1 DUF3278 domain-containing protein [Planococcus sp. Urea-trap-24]PKG89997.1 DUF3278 domain-containing protein [Planococcus sp. Urea-3u-39]PKH35709.1 DUF3278 domain-containing protein [Planococcus sp. MB-3u-09]
MKSWISFLLPDDEYKEKKLLHFLSEGAIILFLSLLVTLISSRFINFDTETVLFLHVVLFVIYVLGRYIISGIEFTNIATEQEYKKELKVIVVKSAGFTAMFILVYPFISGLPASISEWLGTLGFSTLAGLMMFFINFISLKRSYNRNKELM